MSETSVVAQDLFSEIADTGYYPDLVTDCFKTLLGGEAVRSYFLHHEATFDQDRLRRHMTVLALTERRLVITHVDEHSEPDAEPGDTKASASTEAVRIDKIESVVVSRLVDDPANYVPGSLPAEAVLTIGWGAVGRIDIEQASCADPTCDADHGFSGAMTNDDFSLRVSDAADGSDRVAKFLDFAESLSRATAQ